jgi:hypothetical protein
MVFPLGMYSVAGWTLGRSLHAGWLSELGHLWLWVALSVWAAVAFGELHHLVVGYGGPVPPVSSAVTRPPARRRSPSPSRRAAD